jgi:teichuronic acid exporter
MPGSSRSDLKKQVNRGLAWVGLASSTVGLLDIVAYAIILALWISNEQLGVAAIAISLFPALDLLADMGLSAAVIQRDDHSEEKISTVFWLNLFMSLALFVILAGVIGPGLAWLQDAPVVAALLGAYGLKLVWQNAYVMPAALMRRELRFKELSIIRIIANVAEFVGKVGSAALGAGIWCFVIGPAARVIVTGIGVQICHPWRPRFVLKLREAIDWAVFGFKASASQILFHLYTNVDYQIVAYFIGKEATGLYTLAYLVVLEPCKVIGEVIIQIAFPTFAKLKYHKDRLIGQFIEFTRMNLVVMLLFLGVVFVSAEELLFAFWGPERVPAAPIMQVLCVVGVLRAVSFVPPPLLDGIGRPGLTLRYMVVASVVMPVSFVIGAVTLGKALGALSVAIAWAVGYPIAFAVLAYLALNQLELSAGAYVRKVIGIPICATIAMLASAGVRWLVLPHVPPLVSLLVTGAVMMGLFLLLLGFTQGISPRSVTRAIKGKSVDEIAEPAQHSDAVDQIRKP